MPPSNASKRGLAWPWNNPASHFDLFYSNTANPTLTWLTNWELWRPVPSPAALEYVPQVRTATEASKIDDFLTGLWGAGQKRAGEARHFLGFNEPDIRDQANLSVEEAVRLWEKDAVPARAKFKFRLGAPAVSSSPEGRRWLRAFFDAVGEEGRRKIAFLPVHWYGLHIEDFEGFLREVYAEFGKPLWVTEFACVRMDGQRATTEEVERFMYASLQLLDGLEFVERYAWFGAMEDPGDWTGKEIALVETSKDGKANLRGLGKIYIASQIADS